MAATRARAHTTPFRGEQGTSSGSNVGIVEDALITIVDDDSLARESAAALVRALGFAVAKFASAEDFLESEDAIQTTCLILDVELPGLSGIALQRRLQEDGRKIPIIFITGVPDERSRRSALSAGAVCFLTKPFDPEVFIDLLVRAVGLGGH